MVFSSWLHHCDIRLSWNLPHPSHRSTADKIIPVDICGSVLFSNKHWRVTMTNLDAPWLNLWVNAKRKCSSKGGAISDSSVSRRPVQTGFHYVTLSIIYEGKPLRPACCPAALGHETDTRRNRFHDENRTRSIGGKRILRPRRATYWVVTFGVWMRVVPRGQMSGRCALIMRVPSKGGTVICVISCTNDFAKECFNYEKNPELFTTEWVKFCPFWCVASSEKPLCDSCRK